MEFCSAALTHDRSELKVSGYSSGAGGSGEFLDLEESETLRSKTQLWRQVGPAHQTG